MSILSSCTIATRSHVRSGEDAHVPFKRQHYQRLRQRNQKERPCPSRTRHIHPSALSSCARTGRKPFPIVVTSSTVGRITSSWRLASKEGSSCLVLINFDGGSPLGAAAAGLLERTVAGCRREVREGAWQPAHRLQARWGRPAEVEKPVR